jgi:hypothetical protein
MEGDSVSFVERAPDTPVDKEKYPNGFSIEQFFCGRTPVTYSWAWKIDELLENEGLEDVSVNSYTPSKRYFRVWTNIILMVIGEYASATASQELKDMVVGAASELKRGLILPCLFPMVALGKKKLLSQF